MKIILLGNYRLDKQESMERFTLMLAQGFNKEGVLTEIWRPIVFFGRESLSPNMGVGKYLGYIDKWVLFPIILKLRLLKKSNSKNNIYYHVCDHSNSPYLKHLPTDKSGITCHDVLAIRGALGYTDAYCPATGMGKILQKWILQNLSLAQNVICVSNYTFIQLKELSNNVINIDRNWEVIHNAFNANFWPMSNKESETFLKNTPLVNNDFILHVGSSLPRKNRKLLLEMIVHLGNEWNGYVCYAGEAIDDELLDYAKRLGVAGRIVSVVRPDHMLLVALYSSCKAFIFPSLSEGFGWPVIEAQACGAPVIASDLDPMPEVSGGAALHIAPTDPQSFAKAFIKLKSVDFCKNLIQLGFENIQRFSNDQMIKRYLTVYESKNYKNK
jgi:glycosyltransferase involved in cell wall biosynthesis